MEVKETQEHRMNPVIPMTVTDETDFQDSHAGVQEEEEASLSDVCPALALLWVT